MNIKDILIALEELERRESLWLAKHNKSMYKKKKVKVSKKKDGQ